MWYRNYDSVSADLSDGMPLDNDRIAIKIAESLREEDVPSEWMLSMRAGTSTRCFYTGPVCMTMSNNIFIIRQSML
jgi:hypothetical protein